MAKSAFPEAGTLVGSIDPGGIAANLGFAVGDVISEVDGKPTNQRSMKSLHTNEPQVLTVVSPAGVARRINVPPGLLGYNAVEFVRPEIVYLRHANRDARWDSYAAVGAATCQSIPDLAETAWFHAFKAGYVADFMSDYCALQIAWLQGRNDDAVGRCARLQARANVPESLALEMTVQQIGTANLKIPQALARRMTAEPGPPAFDDTTSKRLTALLDLHRGLSPEARREVSPSTVAFYDKTSLMPTIKPIRYDNDKDQMFRDLATKELVADRAPLKMEIPLNYYRLLLERPTVEADNVELVLSVKLKAGMADFASNHRVVGVGSISVSLLDCDVIDASMPLRSALVGRMVTATVESPGLLTVKEGQKPEPPIQLINVLGEIGENRPFTLRLIRALGRDEVWLNQRRVLYLPAAEHPKRIGFQIFAIGADAEVRVQFNKLDPRLAKLK